MLVKLLKIDSSPETPVLLGADHHAVAPSVQGSQGDLLQHAQADIFANPAFTSSCQWMGMLVGVWQGLGCGVDAQGERWASHRWE